MEVLKPTFEKTKSEFQDSFVSNNVVKKGRPKKTQAGNSKLTVETKEKNK